MQQRDVPAQKFPALPLCQTELSAVDALIRRVQRVAANRPDPMHILAQTISMTGEIGADPYAVLGVLIEGGVLIVVQHAEQQTENGRDARPIAGGATESREIQVTVSN